MKHINKMNWFLGILTTLSTIATFIPRTQVVGIIIFAISTSMWVGVYLGRESLKENNGR